jgi:trehalose synthase
MVVEKIKKRLKKYGYKLKKDVHIVFHEPPNEYLEMAALWRCPSSIVLQMSTKEGFGMVVAEAAWSGKPVIGTNVGGIPDQIIHNKTGFLVSPKDYLKAAIYAKKLIENPGLADKMGKKAALFAGENFLITANLFRWLKLVNET